MTVFNHLGQCVTDLERSKQFYVDVLGFEPWRESAKSLYEIP